VRALAESESAATTSDYLTQCVTFRVVPEAAFADLAAPREIATVGGAVLEWTGSPALGGTGRFRVRYPSGGAVHTFYASPPSTGDPLDGNPWDIWSAAEDAGSLQSNTWTVAWGVGWCACARGRAGSTPPTEARLFGEGVLPDSPPDYPELHVWRDASRSTVFEATPAVVQPAHPDGFFGQNTQSDRDPWTGRTVAELTAYGPQPSPFQVMESMTAIFQKNNRSSNREQGGLLAADRAHLYDGPFNQLWGEDSPFFADPSIPTTARMIRLVPAAQIRDEAWMGDDEEATTLRWKTRDYF